MSVLLFLIGRILTPVAGAVGLETVGADDPSIATMWGQVKGIFPHTNLGTGAPAFFFIYVAQLILATIAAAGVMLMIYAGIVLSTSQGEKLEDTKKIIKNVAIGLIAAMLADTIILAVLSFVQLVTSG